MSVFDKFSSPVRAVLDMDKLLPDPVEMGAMILVRGRTMTGKSAVVSSLMDFLSNQWGLTVRYLTDLSGENLNDRAFLAKGFCAASGEVLVVESSRSPSWVLYHAQVVLTCHRRAGVLRAGDLFKVESHKTKTVVPFTIEGGEPGYGYPKIQPLDNYAPMAMLPEHVPGLERNPGKAVYKRNVIPGPRILNLGPVSIRAEIIATLPTLWMMQLSVGKVEIDRISYPKSEFTPQEAMEDISRRLGTYEQFRELYTTRARLAREKAEDNTKKAEKYEELLKL